MDTVLAIGLNVGSTEPRKQLQKTLDQVQRFVGYWSARLSNVRIIESDWKGMKERTLQVRVTELPHDVPGHVFREMAVELKQEAIAAWLTGSDQWTFHYAAGRSAPASSLVEYPIKV